MLARLSRERKRMDECRDANQMDVRDVGKTAAIIPGQSLAMQRLRADVLQLRCHPTTHVRRSDNFFMSVEVHPRDGFWSGGVYVFELHFSEQFPMEGPKVRYVGPQRIFHPNIEGHEREEVKKNDDGDDDGMKGAGGVFAAACTTSSPPGWGVCLGMQEQWKPHFVVGDVVAWLEMLLREPNPQDPLPGVSAVAAQLLREDEQRFATVVRRWMSGDYAMP